MDILSLKVARLTSEMDIAAVGVQRKQARFVTSVYAT